MTKKKLIVSGCSFTDKNFWSQSQPDYDCSFPKWPELLGEKLNLDVVNLGACGAGNNYIYSTLLEEIIRTPKEEIGLVIAAWSQVQRDDWEEHGKFIPRVFSYKDKHNSNMIWRNKRQGKDGNVFYWMLDHLRRYVSFDSLCKSHDIPYKQFQMLTPFDGFLNGLMKTDFERSENEGNPDFVARYAYEPILDNMHEDRKYLLKKIVDYEKYIDTENFLGWPIHRRINGFAVEQKTLMTFPEQHNKVELIIGGYDYHPNGDGHKKIAEYLHGQLA
jgi:hypothetical protein|tara:strand:- start:40114 stop:40935 length:822 start_codon:yes stop_codon:yes gene_type:complete